MSLDKAIYFLRKAEQALLDELPADAVAEAKQLGIFKDTKFFIVDAYRGQITTTRNLLEVYLKYHADS